MFFFGSFFSILLAFITFERKEGGKDVENVIISGSSVHFTALSGGDPWLTQGTQACPSHAFSYLVHQADGKCHPVLISLSIPFSGAHWKRQGCFFSERRRCSSSSLGGRGMEQRNVGRANEKKVGSPAAQCSDRRFVSHILLLANTYNAP